MPITNEQKQAFKAAIDAVSQASNVDGLEAMLIQHDAAISALGGTGGEGGGLSEAQVDARADARIAAWVGAAPGALDTLAEIATALGDDQTAIDGLTSAIAGKADAAHTHAQADVTGLVAALAGKASSTHSHAISDTTGLQDALDGKQASGSYAAASHAHVIADTTGLQAALDGKQSAGSYAAASHTHAQADITNLVSDLAGKASTSHNHDGVYQPLATVLTNTTASFTTAQETKLSGIASGATANATDAQLRDRSTHTGTQTAATISDFSTAADARIAAASVNALSDVTVTSPSVGQVLKWNGSAWVNDTDSTSAGGTPGYAIAVQALTSSPVDAQTIYFGTLPKAPVTVAATSKVYIRKTGTIKIAEIYCYSGTAGTGEAWSLYIRKNNTTDTLIATVSAATSERVFTNAALSIAVVSGDYIEIKAVNPTWATNPLTCIFGGYIYIEG